MRAIFATVVTALAAVSLYGCGGDDTTTQKPAPPASTTPVATMNIVELAEATASLSTLVSLLQQYDLVDTLSGPGPFTVFAPDNEAFAAAQSVIDTLSPGQIKDVLLYHVVPVAATSSELSVDESLPTVFTPNNLTVATITPNVTIHPDGPGAADATVTTANVMATNGVVHIVNAVLVPILPATTVGPDPASSTSGSAASSTTGSAASTTSSGLMNIVELALNVPSLSTLASLLQSHDLVATLEGPGPFTVFAPNNDAFTAAQSVIDGLTDAQITDVLTYHVVSGAKDTAADLTADESLPTVFTDHSLTVQTITPDVTIHPDGPGASDAKVILADQMASNGVVHVIDAVLVPALPAQVQTV